MDKIVGQVWFFNLCMATDLEEEKRYVQTC